MTAASLESQLMNILVRMVIPLRREFGRQLNVSQFMQDPDYARSVLDVALGSQDTRLRDYAQYVNGLMSGARVGTRPPAPAPSVPSASPPKPAADEAAAAEVSEDELRARVMRKYTTGLR